MMFSAGGVIAALLWLQLIMSPISKELKKHIRSIHMSVRYDTYGLER